MAWFEEVRDEFMATSLGNRFPRIPVGRLVPLRAGMLGLESRERCRCPSCCDWVDWRHKGRRGGGGHPATLKRIRRNFDHVGGCDVVCVWRSAKRRRVNRREWARSG